MSVYQNIRHRIRVHKATKSQRKSRKYYEKELKRSEKDRRLMDEVRHLQVKTIHEKAKAEYAKQQRRKHHHESEQKKNKFSRKAAKATGGFIGDVAEGFASILFDKPTNKPKYYYRRRYYR